MKFRKFLDDHVSTLLLVAILIATIITFVILRFDASRSIEDQINALYEKEKLVSQDFAEAYELSDVTCYINDNNNVIIFRDNDCQLKVTYSKNGELLTKEFKDLRTGNDFWESFALIFAIGCLTGMLSTLLVCVLVALLPNGKEKRAANSIGLKKTDIDH